ncbi:MAG: hypothetical protein IIA00_05590 [Proteobacteria bacterium]|nr:hypothetical protein [Pseudomonadota bacterium]
MPKPGERFHRLVEHIERAIAANDRVTIESPKKLRDKDTGRLREHDIVLTFHEKHHVITMSLECRDRSRLIGVPQIEAFQKKCERTGIHRGVMVSSLGFTKTALEKASSLEVGCLSLEEAEGFDWCQARGIEVATRHVQHVSIKVSPKDRVVSEFELHEKNIGKIGLKEVNKLAAYCMRKLSPIGKSEEKKLMDFNISNFGDYFIIDNGGNLCELTGMHIFVTYETKIQLMPFSFHKYFDAAKKEIKYSTAIAEMTVSGVEGSIVMVNKDDEGTVISFVRKAKP